MAGVGIVLSRRVKQISAAFKVCNLYITVHQSNLRDGDVTIYQKTWEGGRGWSADSVEKTS